MLENIKLFDFDLNESEMKELNNLNRNEHLCWNPDLVI